MKNICKKCGSENRLENRFCTQCGEALPLKAEKGPRLLMLSAEGNSHIVFPLPEGKSYIGRDIENTIVIDDTQISKQHACLDVSQGKVFVQDMDSRNGIYLNGKKIQRKTALKEGSLLKLGSTILRYENN